MNVKITFRHMDASDALKEHVRQKLVKLQKFLREPMTAKVTFSVDKLRHVAETGVFSGDARYEAKEASEDMYTSIDRVMEKLERQVRGTKGVKEAKKKRSGATLRGGKKPEVVNSPVASTVSSSKKASMSSAAKKDSSKGKTAAKASKKSA